MTIVIQHITCTWQNSDWAFWTTTSPFRIQWFPRQDNHEHLF